MTLSYKSAVAQMYALGHELAQLPSHKFDLAHMRALMEALNHPEKKFPSVLIAGTNGKGSTAATLASILKAAGLRAGLYTSPHLIRINERIRIDAEAIGDADFAQVHGEVEEVAQRLVQSGRLPWHPSFFEMLTAMAFVHFAAVKPDLVVLEVGMGGRLDATNVAVPRVSIITDISLDHQKFLGSTVSQIAREKVGIIRPGGVVVTLPQLPEANDVIGNAILDCKARAVDAVRYVPPVTPASTQYPFVSGQGPERSEHPAIRQHYPLEVLGEKILVQSPLVGRHQLRNVALAIAAAIELREQGWTEIAPASIEQGIRETHWPGRFQVLPAAGNEPEYVFDVAHNPAGAWALRSTLSAAYGDRLLTLVFGVLRDKAVSEIAEILFPLAEHVVVTRAENPRSATSTEIRQAAARVAADIQDTEDAASALKVARGIAAPDGVVVVTGSIYIVGEAMRILGGRI